jgi:hypothetical protein
MYCQSCQVLIVIIRAIHVLVWTKKNLTEQSYIDFEKYKLDRTEIQFKPNRFDSVKFSFFFVIKLGNLIGSMKWAFVHF